jgi:hypothetical protein
MVWYETRYLLQVNFWRLRQILCFETEAAICERDGLTPEDEAALGNLEATPELDDRPSSVSPLIAFCHAKET